MRPTPSSESSEVRWVPESGLPGYTMDRSTRIRINDFLSRTAAAAAGLSTTTQTVVTS